MKQKWMWCNRKEYNNNFTKLAFSVVITSTMGIGAFRKPDKVKAHWDLDRKSRQVERALAATDLGPGQCFVAGQL